MSGDHTDEARSEFSSEFGMTDDPLAVYEPSFDRLSADPFDLCISEIIEPSGTKESTIDLYRVAFGQWKTYMAEQGRHPACPNESHVVGFVEWLRSQQSNFTVRTIRNKLIHLNRAYRFWQQEPTLPHSYGYNPFELGREKVRWADYDDEDKKPIHYIPLRKIRGILSCVDDIRKHAYIATQLKLGLRVGELCNLRLEEVNLQHERIRECYPNLGTDRRVEERPNSLYIPSKYERDGNKSAVGRVLPLDDEMEKLLERYLTIRPTGAGEWVFISEEHTQSTTKDVNRAWKSAFYPEYDETDSYRAVTSHFGRHYFTSYWRIEQELPLQHVQYMRGDLVNQELDAGNWTSIDPYLHVHYEDIEDQYRDEIYTLDLV
jgi:integrase/recombinase XerD